jgi:hypothetical protein
MTDNVAMPTAAKPPYETTLLVRDCCLCLHVQRAARALARRFDDAFRPLDLTNGQFSLLMSLNRRDVSGGSPRPLADADAKGKNTAGARASDLEEYAPGSGESAARRGSRQSSAQSTVALLMLQTR